MTAKMTPLRGNTYPIKDKLKAMGARWNADEKCWMLPEDKIEAATTLMNAAPVPVPGVCSKCGKPCKAPYTLCLQCKPAPRHCRQCGATPNNRGWPRIYRNGICSDCYQSEREEAEMGY